VRKLGRVLKNEQMSAFEGLAEIFCSVTALPVLTPNRHHCRARPLEYSQELGAKMPEPDFTSPRTAARAFTPKLSAFVDSPLFDQVWSDPDLGLRERSIATVSALIATGAFEELPAHLRRAEQNGLTHKELAALITHLAFYVGFPSAITASAVAADILTTSKSTKD
jgi:4-carboxymuconolactone decarboxylase